MSKDKNVFFKIIAVVFVLLLALLVAGLYFGGIKSELKSNDSKFETNVKKAVKIELEGSVNEIIEDIIETDEIDIKEFKDNYMEGCMTEADNGYCECSWNYLLKVYGKDGLIRMSVDILRGEISDELIEAMFDAYAKCE